MFVENFWWAQQLMAERGALNLSREDVADESGVAVSTIRRMELGERAGTIDNLADLCQVYGLSLATFFARAEERRSSTPADDLAAKRANRSTPATVRPKAARKDKGPDA